MRVCGQDTLKCRTPFFNCHRLPAKMFLLLWTATILAATLCDGAFIPKDLACPQGGFITREMFCEDSPGCPSGEDSDTIHPRGPCIILSKWHFHPIFPLEFIIGYIETVIFLLKLKTILRPTVSFAVPTKRSSHWSRY